SAYYGANAFACVINIITFDVDELAGTRVRGVTETTGTVKGTVIHAGGDADLGWRLSSTLSSIRNMEQDFKEGDSVHGNAKLGWQAGEETRLTFDAGISDGTIYHVPTTQTLTQEGTAIYGAACSPGAISRCGVS
ncbi:MAG TPA: hypothetical protein PK625_11275, partial [Spirochaetales bacterium]|nr:hypothetical protein [Spirochaetales bacterium]